MGQAGVLPNLLYNDGNGVTLRRNGMAVRSVGHAGAAPGVQLSHGDHRKPSALGDIQPDHWLPEDTEELLNVLDVPGLLVQLEPQQADLLARVVDGPLVTSEGNGSGGVGDGA
jgi:hypothetical protein